MKRVNQRLTRCSNGRMMPECYVAEIDWNGQTQVDNNRALVRGDLITKRFNRFGRLGVLRINESWQAATVTIPAGEFYRVKDRGVRCITHPCLTHHEAKLNSGVGRNIAGVGLKTAGATDELISEASAAMTSVEGIIVAGRHEQVTGPAGKANELKATQFYLRTRKTSANKPCFKTGCSKQVCADEDVVTTCEWRDEYACYQKATCERQADGACAFTKTPELTACLRKAR